VGLLAAVTLVQGAAAAPATPRGAPAAGIDFNRDIRPIFSENCYACHGPDEGKRKAGLRLDRGEDAFRELKSGNRALVPRDLAKSELIHRITTPDQDERMPPAATGKRLTPEQVELLRRWVAQGAEWKPHWSFIVPERPPLPAVKQKEWPRNEIDQFVLVKAESAGLSPAPEADKTSLARRVSLDLTGLPPTIEEVDAFLTDKRPDAYEKLVDRLLASPHFGERLALNWLDLARYADTSGYHFDGVRFMWLWRDWVIQAFNRNMPFDRFTLEQLAGDLLPNPTIDQRVASGFNRNNMTTDEGGADPDEYLNKYAVDRVDTTGAVWLGMTVGCAECHDHKYDRLTQREFYQLYAFFNKVPEKGLDRIRTDNPPPRLPVPTPEQAREYVERDFALRDAEKTLQDRQNELPETQEKWERETNASPPPAPTEQGLRAVLSFEDTLEARPPPTTNAAPAPKLVGAERPTFSPGRQGKALELDGKSQVEYGPLLMFDRTNAFSHGGWVKLRKPSGCILSRMAPEPAYRGFDLLASEGRFEVHLVHQWPDDALKVKSKDSFPTNQWLHVFTTYDGSGKAGGVKLYVNGKPRELEAEKDHLTNSIVTTEPVRLGSRAREAVFAGLLDEVRFYDRVVAEEEVRSMVLAGYLPVIARTGGQRTPEEQDDLRRLYREHYAVAFIRSEAALAHARKAKEEIIRAVPSTMVMAELDKPPETFVLVRGDFRNRGERVNAGVPSFLPPLPEGQPASRLALARWLTATNHPLTARVTVNRYWQLMFGAGLVKTVNDFGSQGEWPSHPELLDWLACQFRDGGPIRERVGSSQRLARRTVGAWDLKQLLRLMVTSASYRQSAAVTPEKLERDPANRLLTRGPRHRLAAELVRDNALAISGLLNPAIGGPSIKPYQPPGIWDGTDAEYVQDHGTNLYRRGMYVFWRRSAHYPSFATFDAPNREVCTLLRQRTQTPLQSLVLMNDPVYVEAARALAQRVLREEPRDPHKRLERAFRHALARQPRPDELAVLERAYDRQLANFQRDPDAARGILGVGESKSPEQVEPGELAALTAVASVLLNLNETISN
jgi:mono/diheme cytochrome c family protein